MAISPTNELRDRFVPVPEGMHKNGPPDDADPVPGSNEKESIEAKYLLGDTDSTVADVILVGLGAAVACSVCCCLTVSAFSVTLYKCL